MNNGKVFRSEEISLYGFEPSGCAVINHDDRRGVQIRDAINTRAISYGITSAADVQVKNMKFSITGTTLTLSNGHGEFTFTMPLIGKFNVYNVLAAYSAGIALGIPRDQIYNRYHII